MITKVQKKLKYAVDFKELSLESIEVGTIVPYDIYAKLEDGFVLIVKAGTMIDEKIYRVLSEKQIYLSRNDSGKEKLSCKNLEIYVSQSKKDPKYCMELLYKMDDRFFDEFYKSENYKFDSQDVEGIVKSIILLVKDNKNFVKENMIHFKNDFALAHHSLHVCFYAINIAYALGFNDMELLNLGIAGYLIDIGIKKIDENIVSKDSPLSEYEVENIRKHPFYSVQIAQHNRIHQPDIINAIRHHHENYDGSGYPDGLTHDHISRYASILSICDVFDALTSKRPYREEKTSFEALTFMMKDANMENRFDHKYIKIFISLLVK